MKVVINQKATLASHGIFFFFFEVRVGRNMDIPPSSVIMMPEIELGGRYDSS